MITDHRPLTTLFGPKKGIPPIAAARLQRWAVQFAAYSNDIQFKPTNDHGNADALSRLPLKVPAAEHTSIPSVYNTRQIAYLPVSSKAVEQATRRDLVLGKVLHYTRMQVGQKQCLRISNPFTTDGTSWELKETA